MRKHFKALMGVTTLTLALTLLACGDDGGSSGGGDDLDARRAACTSFCETKASVASACGENPADDGCADECFADTEVPTANVAALAECVEPLRTTDCSDEEEVDAHLVGCIGEHLSGVDEDNEKTRACDNTCDVLGARILDCGEEYDVEDCKVECPADTETTLDEVNTIGACLESIPAGTCDGDALNACLGED